MTAPRWEDAREHALKLLREERDSLTAELPRIENVDERELFDAWLARVDLALATIGAIDDAALARLAEPAQSDAHPCARRCWRIGAAADLDNGVCVECGSTGKRQPTAAERWRAVPADAKDRLALRLESMRVKASLYDRRDDAAAADALLALAREAERGGV